MSSKKNRKKKATEDYEEGAYEVEEILDASVSKDGQKMYFVRWEGYGSEDNSWVMEKDMHCTELLAAFLESQELPRRKKDAKSTRTSQGQDPLTSGLGSSRSTDRAEAKKKIKEEIAEVDEILDADFDEHGEARFKVRWLGYGPEYDEWLYRKEMHCTQLIEDFMITQNFYSPTVAVNKTKRLRGSSRISNSRSVSEVAEELNPSLEKVKISKKKSKVTIDSDEENEHAQTAESEEKQKKKSAKRHEKKRLAKEKDAAEMAELDFYIKENESEKAKASASTLAANATIQPSEVSSKNAAEKSHGPTTAHKRAPPALNRDLLVQKSRDAPESNSSTRINDPKARTHKVVTKQNMAATSATGTSTEPLRLPCIKNYFAAPVNPGDTTAPSAVELEGGPPREDEAQTDLQKNPGWDLVNGRWRPKIDHCFARNIPAVLIIMDYFKEGKHMYEVYFENHEINIMTSNVIQHYKPELLIQYQERKLSRSLQQRAATQQQEPTSAQT